MTTWIALFRGINVGGNNLLPMAELRRDLEALGHADVRTSIQSGNVVFEATSRSASALGEKISRCVEEGHGFRPQVLLLRPAELVAAVDGNPFPEAVSDPKTLHYVFLERRAAKADTAALDRLKADSESYRLTDRVFYLHAPDGIGRSRLAAQAEKHLGVVTTSRNHRTVEKLLAMIAG